MSKHTYHPLADELLEQLRRRRVVWDCQWAGSSVTRSKNTLAKDENIRLLEFAGLIKGGLRDLSSRKGFSRK